MIINCQEKKSDQEHLVSPLETTSINSSQERENGIFDRPRLQIKQECGPPRAIQFYRLKEI